MYVFSIHDYVYIYTYTHSYTYAYNYFLYTVTAGPWAEKSTLYSEEKYKLHCLHKKH